MDSLSASKNSMLMAAITKSTTGKGFLRIFKEELNLWAQHKPNCLLKDAESMGHYNIITTEHEF